MATFARQGDRFWKKIVTTSLQLCLTHRGLNPRPAKADVSNIWTRIGAEIYIFS